MIQLFTDFGIQGPYVGQMHAVIACEAPGVPVIDLMHDAPRFNPQASACLLAALAPYIPEQDVCIAVVDPGVGTTRRPLAVQADQRWFVGPDNGLFAVLPHVFDELNWFEINWQPQVLSSSFHGRDLFAPVGAALAYGEGRERLSAIDPVPAADAERSEIIYIDGYGNAMSGLRASGLDRSARLVVGDHEFVPATTFGDHPPGTQLWYANSCGLAELSVTEGSAAETCGLRIGAPIYIR